MLKTGILNSLIIYIGIFIGFISVLFVFPVCLSAEEYGFRSLLFDTLVVLSTMASFGVPAAILKWFPEFSQKEKPVFNFYFTLVAIIVSSIFVLLFILNQSNIGLFYKDSSQLLYSYLYILPFFLIIYVANSYLDVFCKIYNQTSYSNFFKEISTRVLTIALCFLYKYRFIDFSGFVYGLMFIYCLNFIMLALVLKIRVGLRFIYNKNIVFDFDLLKRIMTYSSFVFLGSASSILVLKMDSLMIGDTGLGSEVRVGIYSMAIYIATLIEIPKRAFIQSVAPKISTLWSLGDLISINALYKSMSNIQFYLGTLCFMLIWNNTGEFYSLVKNNEIYAQGIYVVGIIGCAKLLDMAFSYNSEIIGYSTIYKWNLYINVLLMLLAFVTNSILIPEFGINGAAIATFLSLFVINITRLIILKYKYDLFPFSSQTLKIILLGLPLLFIKDIIDISFNIYLSVLIKSLIVVGVFGLYLLFDKKTRALILRKFT